MLDGQQYTVLFNSTPKYCVGIFKTRKDAEAWIDLVKSDNATVIELIP